MRLSYFIPAVVIGMFVAVSPASSVESDPKARPWQFDQTPSIKGVSLGSSLDRTIKLLGSPRREIDLPRDDEMGMGDLKNLQYEGLLVRLCRPQSEEKYYVWRIQLSSDAWLMSPGLHIGMPRGDVVAALGPPENSSINDGVETLHYSFRAFDGWLWVEIGDGKLVKVGMTEDWS